MFDRFSRWRFGGALGAGAVALGAVWVSTVNGSSRGKAAAVPPAPAPAVAPAAAAPADGQAVRAPELRFGDSWTVIVQAAHPEDDGAWQTEEAWQFTVTGVRADQTVVEARRAGSSGIAPVTLLLDPSSGTLRRSRVVLPANFGPKMVDREYQADQPCVNDLSPVPFDRPAFPLIVPVSKKGAPGKPFTQRVFEAADTAAPGHVRFSSKTVQRVYPTDAKAAEKILARDQREGSRGAEAGAEAVRPLTLAAQPRWRVEIKVPGGKSVEQLWAPSIPWPVYSASSTTRAWMVEFNRSKG